MSTADESWRPAVVPDPPDQPDAPVRFGPAEGNEIKMLTALTIVDLWHARAAANVGTALTVPEVFELLLPLLTPEILSIVLTTWCGSNPALFGAYLAEAFTGSRPSRTRGPNKGQADE